MHDIGYLAISDIPIFSNSFWPIVDIDLFIFVCLETTPSLSCAEMINNDVI